MNGLFIEKTYILTYLENNVFVGTHKMITTGHISESDAADKRSHVV